EESFLFVVEESDHVVVRVFGVAAHESEVSADGVTHGLVVELKGVFAPFAECEGWADVPWDAAAGCGVDPDFAAGDGFGACVSDAACGLLVELAGLGQAESALHFA